jgi:predicted pyridoxine 5'-phosphate oxidase superfamily flavin-nucleotide-binding protein
MQRSIDEIATELVQLPKRDRLEIARFLLFLDNRSSGSSDANSEWEQEITDRVRAVRDETATGIDYEKAKRQIENRFAK